MTIVLFILWVIVLAKLLAVAAITPHRSRYSEFELGRRRDASDPSIAKDAQREQAYVDIVSVQRVVQALLLVLLTLLSVVVFGWFIGTLIAVVISLEYSTLASFVSLRTAVARYYDRYEPTILEFVTRHQSFLRWLRSVVPTSEHKRIESREELQSLVEASEGVVTNDEKKLITASLQFDQTIVKDIMTPKSVVDTIKKQEVLGPLVLDDLHKTGHSRFPVIDEDIDHVVGILYVRDVLTLDTNKKHTAKVEMAMSKRVYYIREDHTLAQALSAFLSTHHHLFIVINEFRETVGIVTLEDTLESLLGRRIVDEFDAHDDMRAVATRNARHHTRTAESKDI